MGCFNVSCGVSHLTIHEGDQAFLFPIIPNISNYEIENGYASDDETVSMGPCSMILSPHDYFIPFCFPIEGTYDGYGSLEDIVKTKNTEAIEAFLNITIEEFIALITDNRGKDVYDTFGSFYEVFFEKKELMSYEVNFETFLTNMGFKKNEDGFTSPDNKYDVVFEMDDNKINTYIWLLDETGIKRSKRINLDRYDQKEKLLKFHHSITGEYLGVIKEESMKIMKKISGMFVMGDIYNFLAQKNKILKEHPESIKMSRYILKKLGFEMINNNHMKKGSLVAEVNYSVKLIYGRYSATVYDFEEFLRSYKDLTGENLDVTELENCDNTDFKFENMLLDYEDCKIMSKEYKRFLPEQLLERFAPGIDGLQIFKDWKYFFPIYNCQIENRNIQDAYLKYMRFYPKMYNVNSMFIPTFQGPQGGNSEAEKELLEISLNIINKRFCD